MGRKARKPKNPKNPSSEPIQRNLPTTISKQWSERGKGTPPLAKVHEAFRDKHITLEEAKDLNPKYTGLSPNTVNLRKRGGLKTGVTIKSVGLDGSIGKNPSMRDVNSAVRNNKITSEEAQDLNPHYGAPPKINKYPSTIPEGGHTPAAADIHRAVANKHIDVEQAVDLNPKYATRSFRNTAVTHLRARGETVPRVSHFDSEMRKIMKGNN